MSQAAETVRVVTDIRTFDPEGLVKLLKAEKDGVGDHLVAVVLPSLGFEEKAQAGGTYVHQHEPDDRSCLSIARSDRMYRDDGQDEI